jgi:hypothetical protein
VSSNPDGLDFEGAELERLRVVKSPRRVTEGEGSSMELEGASLESLRVVKFSRSHAEGVDLKGGGFTWGSSRGKVWLQSAEGS